jgi:PAS domain S-box-containing protein
VAAGEDWGNLFTAAFAQSRNPMVLVDSGRCFVDVNGAWLKLLGYRRTEMIGRPLFKFVLGGPQLSVAEWRELLATQKFTGEGRMVAADGATVAVQYAATTEVVTGRKLVLVVTLTSSRWGGRFRRVATAAQGPRELSAREREIVRLVALGNTGPEIAEELRITHETVRTHVRNAMEKTSSRSRAHLVAKALGEGLALR